MPANAPLQPTTGGDRSSEYGTLSSPLAAGDVGRVADRGAVSSQFPAVVGVGGVSRTDLRARLAQAGVRLNPAAEQLFSDARFGTAEAASLVDVVAVDVAGLGFPSGATFAQLTEAASARGLSLCPLELGPHLRLQFTGQADAPAEAAEVRGRAPPGAMTVASALPPDEDDVPWGFYLRRVRGELWLRGYRCWSGHVWAPDDVLVFLRLGSPASEWHGGVRR